MRPNITISIIILLLFTTCKKDHSDTYSGNFYIRLPLVENAYTYYIPSIYYDELYIIYNRQDLKRLWKFIPVGENQYNIGVADSSSLLITDSGELAIAPKDAGLSSRQIFKIIRDQHSNAVYLQSAYSGKFIHLEYCFKGTET